MSFKSGAGFLRDARPWTFCRFCISCRQDVMGQGSCSADVHFVEVRIGRAITAAGKYASGSSSEVAGHIAARRLMRERRDRSRGTAEKLKLPR